MIDIIDITYQAWRELDVKVFVAAWMVTGYFDAEHFADASAAPPVVNMEAAIDILDPAHILENCNLSTTPQMCTKYEWQIEACCSLTSHPFLTGQDQERRLPCATIRIGARSGAHHHHAWQSLLGEAAAAHRVEGS